jgi:hypothetical protein
MIENDGHVEELTEEDRHPAALIVNLALVV